MAARLPDPPPSAAHAGEAPRLLRLIPSRSFSSAPAAFERLLRGRLAVLSAPTPLAGRGVTLPHANGHAAGWPAGGTSWAARCIYAVQQRGEPAVWVEPAPGTLHPPDLADGGIDLAALPLVRPPPGRGPRWAIPLLRAAEVLLRSGGFGLVVVDLRAFDRPPPRIADPWTTRLAALVRRHDSRLLLLAGEPASPHAFGPMVQLRIAPRTRRQGPGRFVVETVVERCKGALPVVPAPSSFRGPWGLF